MKYFCLLISLMFIFSGCAQKKLSEEQLVSEKKAVETRILHGLDVYSKKDMSSQLELISTSEFLGFGTDSAEVIKGAEGWQNQLKNDFVLMDEFAFSKPRILSVTVSENADLASALVEIPAEILMQGKATHTLVRFAETWRKENGKWMMIYSLAQFASNGQSSEELVAKMASEKK